MKNVTLDIDTMSRIAFVGQNGDGKSTVLATIAQSILPLKGKIMKHPRLRVAYFAQHHAKVWFGWETVSRGHFYAERDMKGDIFYVCST